MNKIKVSICVSVHNTEKYLRRCLDSLVAQTLVEKQIVLVNNGSMDSSLDIMHEYVGRYPYLDIKVISQEDMGLAQGRQTGVNNSTGKYIGFVDADDYVDKNMYKSMYDDAITYNADIVECKTRRDGEIIGSNLCGIHNSKEVFKKFLAGLVLPTMLWMRIYKKNLFNGGLIFPKMYVNNEDAFAFPCLLYKADYIFYSSDIFYTYSSDNENAVMSVLESNDFIDNKKFENRKNILDAVEHITNYVGKKTIEEYYRNEFEKYKNRIYYYFCAYDMGNIRAKKRIVFVCKLLNLTEREFANKIKRNDSINKKVRYLIYIVGLTHCIEMVNMRERYKNKIRKLI